MPGTVLCVLKTLPHVIFTFALLRVGGDVISPLRDEKPQLRAVRRGQGRDTKCWGDWQLCPGSPDGASLSPGHRAVPTLCACPAPLCSPLSPRRVLWGRGWMGRCRGRESRAALSSASPPVPPLPSPRSAGAQPGRLYIGLALLGLRSHSRLSHGDFLGINAPLRPMVPGCGRGSWRFQPGTNPSEYLVFPVIPAGIKLKSSPREHGQENGS